ncbi:hypothetical protein KIN20_027281 [Parelaphostrongylus tenuis]|uniref:C2H2-type domain-containing protein n=1 Tax=Parelaphostrongylus tenuis TaxID=148309 RepID=A0AAD5WDN7_PARTN|nr:hypothetical protein KIN20_027281 [Parelaphostrongylus tenuis]
MGRTMHLITSISNSTIYLISCKACGGKYIGEASRPLHIRIREHLDGKTNKDPSKPLGTHRMQRHNDDDFESTLTEYYKGEECDCFGCTEIDPNDGAKSRVITRKSCDATKFSPIFHQRIPGVGAFTQYRKYFVLSF